MVVVQTQAQEELVGVLCGSCSNHSLVRITRVQWVRSPQGRFLAEAYGWRMDQHIDHAVKCTVCGVDSEEGSDAGHAGFADLLIHS